MLSGVNRSDLYTSPFIKKVDEIKAKYNRGQDMAALSDLQAIDEGLLLPTEKALRRNLIGVIYFSKENYEKSIFNFNQALTTSSLDESLTAQINLNLASSYFKMGMSKQSYETLKSTAFTNLKGQEFISYHKLRYRLALEAGDEKDLIISLFQALSDKEKIEDLKSDPLYESLNSKFSKLESSEKNNIFRSLEDEKYFVTGYIAYLEAERLYYAGNRDNSEDLISWISGLYTEQGEIKELIASFSFRIENDIKMKTNTIGVILPLSGDKKKFGERALLGLDASLRRLKQENEGLNIIIKDSKGSAAVGSKMVKELIESDSVSMVIGGLFSSEASREYETAKKRGVFFISLSQIYVSKDEKDHLLLEVPGSIESQVNHLLSEEGQEAFGKRGAIIYPRSKRGEAYVNEFWRKAQSQEIEIKGVYSYDKEKKNFSDPVKNLLGLKYPRVRQEEYDLWHEIYSLESKRSARRIQILKPEIQFDWVFIPSIPLEAIQIIPSFNYYDAYKVKLIGGPSWRSKRLDKESHRFREINFIGEDVGKVSQSLSKSFYSNYGRKISVIELRAFDSMNMAFQILDGQSYKTRDELDMGIRTKKNLSGHTGEWFLEDGIWIKKMSSLHFRRGEITQIKKDEAS
jgi:outer membrane PBP1 activator LpoA protein